MLPYLKHDNSIFHGSNLWFCKLCSIQCNSYTGRNKQKFSVLKRRCDCSGQVPQHCQYVLKFRNVLFYISMCENDLRTSTNAMTTAQLLSDKLNFILSRSARECQKLSQRDSLFEDLCYLTSVRTYQINLFLPTSRKRRSELPVKCPQNNGCLFEFSTYVIKWPPTKQCEKLL